MNRTCRTVFYLIMLCLILSGPAGAAEKFPTKPLSFIIPASPGSGADIMARELSIIAEKQVGQRLLVVNKPGGSGLVALQTVLDQPADGYTLFIPTRSIPPVVLNITKNVTISHKDFEYIMCIAGDYFLLSVNANSPFKTLEDLVAYAKKNPGALKVGGTFLGSTHYLIHTLFAKAAGFKASWVPFKSSGDAVVAIAGGHVDAAISNPETLSAQMDAKKVRVLASSSTKRIYPDVPTFKEKGYGLVELQWRGLMVKKGTPAPIVARLHDVFLNAIKDPRFKNFLVNAKIEEYYLPGLEFTNLVDEEMKKVKEVIAEAGGVK
jgi:tripartite-type tricarboxylate transporter receptor subunit TctC